MQVVHEVAAVLDIRDGELLTGETGGYTDYLYSSRQLRPEDACSDQEVRLSKNSDTNVLIADGNPQIAYLPVHAASS